MRKSSEEIQKQTAKLFLASDSRDGKRRLELDVCEEEERGSDEPRSSEPTKKKSKILGDVDLNDASVRQLLNKKSTHAAALTEVRPPSAFYLLTLPCVLLRRRRRLGRRSTSKCWRRRRRWRRRCRR